MTAPRRFWRVGYRVPGVQPPVDRVERLTARNAWNAAVDAARRFRIDTGWIYLVAEETAEEAAAAEAARAAP